jgi:hypothetical protein
VISKYFASACLLKLQITRIVSTVRAMNCRWNQTPTMSAYREVTMGKLERDLQTDVETERALRRLDGGSTRCALAVNRASRERYPDQDLHQMWAADATIIALRPSS